MTDHCKLCGRMALSLNFSLSFSKRVVLFKFTLKLSSDTMRGCFLEDASWRILLQELFTENSVRSSQKNIQMHQSSNCEVDLVIGEGAYESSFSLPKKVCISICTFSNRLLIVYRSPTQLLVWLPATRSLACLIACRSLTCLSDCLSEAVNKKMANSSTKNTVDICSVPVVP